MTRPASLFKYESINEYSLRNLKNAQLFFNTPASFNDPFDCAINETYYAYGDEDIVKLFNTFQEQGRFGDHPSVKTCDEIPADFVDQCIKGINASVTVAEQRNLHQIGCTCLSETNNQILMWAHYAKGHTGMCLEFDTSKDPFSKALSVSYSNDFPKINPVNIILRDDEALLGKEALKPLVTKYECWEYEKEWRLFHKEPNKLYGYSTDALRAVYFGASVNFADLEIVCLILQGQSKNIKFYQSNKSKTKYELEFEEFTYTPHIKAP